MADVVFLGGDIITVNDAQPIAEAVVVKDGKILAVGSVADVSKHMAPDTRTVDLQGKTLMPGLVEPHSHPSSGSRIRKDFTYIGSATHPTMDNVYSTIEKVVKKTPPGEWLLFTGYDAMYQIGAMLQPPLRLKLDTITSIHPIGILSAHTHHMFFNSLALQLGGITKESVIPKGEISKDENGDLTGLIIECAAYQLVLDAMPQTKKEKYLNDFREEVKIYSAQGVTTVADLAVGMLMGLSDDTPYLEDVQKETDSPVRFVSYIYRLDHRSSLRAKCFEPPTLRPKENSSHLGIKLWADGSPYACNMAVKDPYMDRQILTDALLVKAPCFGELFFSFEELLDLMREPAKVGLQIAVHAQGDRAIDQILDVFEALFKEIPKADHRYRLEHCGLITEDQLQRCKDLGVTVTFYVDHIYYFGHQLSNTFLGEERASRWTPVSLAQKLKVPWTLHQDSPCSPCKPFLSMRTATTRLIHEKPDNQERVLGPEYCVSVDEAIKAWTINAAWQLFHEDVIGSIEEGKLADLIIIDKNPYKVEPRDLDTIQVLETYRNGEQVYSS